MGELSSSDCQKQFQTYPNSDIRLPSSRCALDPQLRPHQLPPHVPSTFGSSSDYVRSRYLSVLPGTDCFAGAATRRSLSTDTTLSPTPSAKVLSSAGNFPSFRFRPRLFRSISLADFRSDRPRTDAVRIFRPTWNRSFRPAPLHAATAPNPSKTPTVSLTSAKE